MSLLDPIVGAIEMRKVGGTGLKCPMALIVFMLSKKYKAACPSFLLFCHIDEHGS